MYYLIPLISAYIVYRYNYRNIRIVKDELREIRSIMNENDKWIIDQFTKITKRIGDLELKVKGLEVRLAMYTGIAVFLSTAILKLSDKIF